LSIAILPVTDIVFPGGVARLAAAARLGGWGPSVALALAMERLVTPALWAWQRRVTRPSIYSPE
jgi:hypothetical protein